MYGQPPPYGQPGYAQPGYGAPPQMYGAPPQQGPMIINLAGNNGGGGSHCPICNSQTGNIPRKCVGTVTILWCLFCFVTTGLFCIPFCTDSCKDTQIICVKCQTIKNKLPANCC